MYELTITDCNIIMTSQTSSLNIAIKNGKQPNNSITAEDCRIYQRGIISNIPNQKGSKTSKTVTYMLKHNK